MKNEKVLQFSFFLNINTIKAKVFSFFTKQLVLHFDLAKLELEFKH
jgi:hypothetical protein